MNKKPYRKRLLNNAWKMQVKWRRIKWRSQIQDLTKGKVITGIDFSSSKDWSSLSLVIFGKNKEELLEVRKYEKDSK